MDLILIENNSTWKFIKMATFSCGVVLKLGSQI